MVALIVVWFVYILILKNQKIIKITDNIMILLNIIHWRTRCDYGGDVIYDLKSRLLEVECFKFQVQDFLSINSINFL